MDDVNRQLEKMGYNIGVGGYLGLSQYTLLYFQVRIIEDFLARTGSQKCGDFRCLLSVARQMVTPCEQGDLGEGAAGLQTLPQRVPHSHQLVGGTAHVTISMLQ